MLGQVLTLLEALVTAGTLKRLLASVDAAVALQLGRVPETLFTVRTLERFLPCRVAAMLHKL